jgi:hypothetical protein
MAKLTLSIDSAVISRAKEQAKRRGVSVSEIVEAYLAAIDEATSSNASAAPVLRSVRGILKTGNLRRARRHLESKYR